MGLVGSIQRFSIHDGPGIRTTVFLMGCGLRCLWCHNPEDLEPSPALQVVSAHCTGCGACAAVCPVKAVRLQDGKAVTDRRACIRCFACAAACPTGARRRHGQEWEVPSLLAEIRKDKAYYDRSGGGLTLSGGEPLLQKDFAADLLAAAREEGIHTAVETALHIGRDALEAALPHTCLFLCDIKAAVPALHKRLTGADNRRILENLAWLDAHARELRLRMPLIPSLNDGEDNLRAVARFILEKTGRRELELLPYHGLAADKYHALDMPYGSAAVTPPSRETMARAMEILEKEGLRAFTQNGKAEST